MNTYLIDGFVDFADQLKFLAKIYNTHLKDTGWHFICEHPTNLLLRTDKELSIETLEKNNLSFGKDYEPQEAEIIIKYEKYMYPIWHLYSEMMLDIEETEDAEKLLERLIHVGYLQSFAYLCDNIRYWHMYEPRFLARMGVDRAMYNGYFNWQYKFAAEKEANAKNSD
jgi:hypothetical protein